jgi:hypothetical protein
MDGRCRLPTCHGIETRREGKYVHFPCIVVAEEDGLVLLKTPNLVLNNTARHSEFGGKRWTGHRVRNSIDVSTPFSTNGVIESCY